MKIKVVYLFVICALAFILAGCCTTEERLANLGESIHNIALDGDGVN